MTEITLKPGQTDIVGNSVEGAKPSPFIYISTALRIHGVCGYYSGPSDNESLRTKSVVFRLFLAKLIETRVIQVFDVFNLDPICLLEREELVNSLNAGIHESHSIWRTVELGRDYCLDREKLGQAISAVRTCHIPEAKISFPTQLPISVAPSLTQAEIDDDWRWDDPQVALCYDRQMAKLISGRLSNRDPSPIALLHKHKWTLDEAASILPTSFPADYLYLSGKMNRAGKPAVFLCNLHELNEPSAPLSSKAQAKEGRNNNWQRRLDEMHRQVGNKQKSHGTLCDELANELNTSLVSKQNGKKISGGTIRTVTRSPWGSKTGGARNAKGKI